MKKIIIIALTGIVILLTIRFLFGGPEDSWICDRGQWVKHGKPSYPRPLVSCAGRTPLPRTKEECLRQGGVWEKQGPEPFETCDRKTGDAGRICRDSSECEGTCLASLTREQIREGMQNKLNLKNQKGTCSEWSVTLGCVGILKKGEVQVYCID